MAGDSVKDLDISRMMAAGVADSVFPGAVLLCAKGNDVLFHEAYGVANLNEQRPMQNNAIFDLASLTKPLATALAVAQLVKEKMLSLDTLLGDVIPAVGQARITIDMLLRHTSGLPAHRQFFISMVKEKHRPRQLLRNLIIKELAGVEPGKKQIYSDLGYMLLSWVIEIISGQRLDQFVREKIYEPLGIRDLFFIDLDCKPIKKDRLVSTQACPWRRKNLTGEVDDDNAWAAGGIEGHAGLFGDALSIHTLCCEILNAIGHGSTLVLDPDVLGSFVCKEQGRDMVAGFDTPSKLNSSAGHFFSPASVGHLGFTGTSFWLDPNSQLIVILLTNRVHPSRANQKIKDFRPQLHDLVSMGFR
ncbi:MAG: serine hydrolase [Desulfobacteraceae bacterium]|nr:serine hydrolase [Desulfobacteraceae bacterium]